MESELSLQPLHLRRRFLAGKYWLKSRYLNVNTECIGDLAILCQNSPFWLSKKKPLIVEMYNLLKEEPVYSCNVLDMYTLNIWCTAINLVNVVYCEVENITEPKRNYLPCNLKYLCESYVNIKFDGHYKIFSDASKDGHNVGAAFYDPQKDHHQKFRIHKNMCIMYAELFALKEALTYVSELDEDQFVILTDSRSALQHLARCTSNSRGTPIAYAILDIILNLRDLNKTVVLQWIPSHVGINGNEIVDGLAKEASSLGTPSTYPPFYTDLIGLVRDHCFELWKEFFDKRSRDCGIWYKTVQTWPLRYPWFDLCKMGRNEIVMALRLRSGHLPLNKFAYLMRKVESPNCSECGVIEDVYHVLMECVRNEAFRRQIYCNNIPIQ